MKILFFILGFVFGAVQFLMTKKTVDLVGKKNTLFILCIIVKLLAYALAVYAFLTVLSACQIPIAAGLGAGMVLSAFINMIIFIVKDKSDNKGDGTA